LRKAEPGPAQPLRADIERSAITATTEENAARKRAFFDAPEPILDFGFRFWIRPAPVLVKSQI
jgi:hypothetical protein